VRHAVLFSAAVQRAAIHANNLGDDPGPVRPTGKVAARLTHLGQARDGMLCNCSASGTLSNSMQRHKAAHASGDAYAHAKQQAILFALCC
jgi:hypothetical protein